MIEVWGKQFSKGERGIIKKPISIQLNGFEIYITAHVVCGMNKGPVIGLTSTSHGPEFLSIEQIREVLNRITPKKLRGTVMAVPVMNPTAFEQMTTVTPEDQLNMNRSFPGKPPTKLKESYVGGTTETITYYISSGIIDQVDMFLDFHLASWGGAISCLDFPAQVTGKTREELMELARLVPIKTIHKWPLPKGSSGEYALSKGKLTLGLELGGGGFGFEQERKWVDAVATGVENIMKKLGMLEGEIKYPGEQWLITERAGLFPKNGGYHVPEVEVAHLDAIVPEDKVLGRTFHTQTFEEVETIVSPYDGILYGIRQYGPIRPSEWAYLVADASKATKLPSI